MPIAPITVPRTDKDPVSVPVSFTAASLAAPQNDATHLSRGMSTAECHAQHDDERGV